jgi:hypothetical protein
LSGSRSACRRKPSVVKGALASNVFHRLHRPPSTLLLCSSTPFNTHRNHKKLARIKQSYAL